MAENKKSFVLYCDLIHTVRKMPKDKVADLFLHILAYVNDENPTTDDMIIDLTFEPIKQQLKRDLKRYEAIVERNRSNGLKGGRPTVKPKKPNGLIGNPKNPVEPKKADNDNVTDNDNVNDTENVKKVRVRFTPPTLLEVSQYFKENGYTEQSALKAFNYYETGDWKDGRGNQVKNWKQKMQSVWFKPENQTTITAHVRAQLPVN